ncbi:hypothetical protein MTO96_002620 [Rhipicephalus appendiculatus]
MKLYDFVTTTRLQAERLHRNRGGLRNERNTHLDPRRNLLHLNGIKRRFVVVFDVVPGGQPRRSWRTPAVAAAISAAGRSSRAAIDAAVRRPLHGWSQSGDGPPALPRRRTSCCIGPPPHFLRGTHGNRVSLLHTHTRRAAAKLAKRRLVISASLAFFSAAALNLKVLQGLSRFAIAAPRHSHAGPAAHSRAGWRDATRGPCGVAGNTYYAVAEAPGDARSLGDNAGAVGVVRLN